MDDNEIEELEIGLEVDNSELKDSIDEAKNIIKQGVGQIENALKNVNFGGSLADSLTKNIQQSIDKALRNVSKNTGTVDIKANVTTNEKTTQNNKSKSSSGSGLGAASNVANVAAASNMNKASNTMKGASGDINKGANKIDGSGTKFKKTGDELGTTTGKLGEANKGLGTASDSLKTAGNNLNETSGTITKASGSLGTVNTSLGTTTGKLGTVNTSLGKVSGEIDDSIINMSEVSEAVLRSAGELDDVGIKVGNTFGEVGSAFKGTTDSLDTISGNFESSGNDINESSGTISGAGEDFVSATGDFAEAVNRLTDVNKAKLYNDEFTNIKKTLSTLATSIKKSLTSGQPVTEKAYGIKENRLNTLEGALEGTLSNYEKELKDGTLKTDLETTRVAMQECSNLIIAIKNSLADYKKLVPDSFTIPREQAEEFFNKLFNTNVFSDVTRMKEKGYKQNLGKYYEDNDPDTHEDYAVKPIHAKREKGQRGKAPIGAYEITNNAKDFEWVKSEYKKYSADPKAYTPQGPNKEKDSPDDLETSEMIPKVVRKKLGDMKDDYHSKPINNQDNYQQEIQKKLEEEKSKTDLSKLSEANEKAVGQNMMVEGLRKDFAEKGPDVAMKGIIDDWDHYSSDIDDTERREQAAKDDRKKRTPVGVASEERANEESSIMKNVPNLEGSTESAVALLKVLDEVNEKYGNTLSTIESGNLSQVLNEQLEFPIDGIEENGHNLSNTLETIAQDAGLSFRDSFEDIANEFDLDPSKMQQAYDTLKQSIESNINTEPIEQVTAEVNKLKDSVDDLDNTKIEPKVSTEPVEQVTKSTDELHKTLSKPAQILADNNPALNAISEVNGKAQLLLKSHPALQNIKETIGDIGEEYYQALGNLGDIDLSQAENQINKLRIDMQSIKQFSANMLRIPVGDVAPSMTAMEQMKKSVRDIANVAKAKVSPAFDKLKTKTQSASNSIKQVAANFLRIPVGKVKPNMNAMNQLKIISDKAKTSIKNVVKGFTELGKKGKDVDKVTKDVKELDDALDKVDVDKPAEETGKLGGKVKGMLGQLAPYIGTYLGFETFKTSITNAMNALNVGSMAVSAFGSNMSEMESWLKDVNSRLGLSYEGTRNFTAQIGMMGRTMGLTADEAMKLSQDVALIAEHASRSRGMELDSVYDDMKDAVMGSYDALEKYGIKMDETEFGAWAVSRGLASSADSMSALERTTAVTTLLTERLGVSEEYLAESMKSPSVQAGLLQSNLGALGTALGNCFLPIVTVILPLLNKLTVAMTTMLNNVATFIRSIFKMFGVEVSGAAQIVTSSVEGMGGSLGDLGNVGGSGGGAGAAADGLDGVGESASGAAKEVEKLKGLMGFDEIQTIKTQQDPASGGSGSGSGGSGGGGLGGSGGGSGIGSLNGSDEKIVPDEIPDDLFDVSGIVNKLKSIFGTLWDDFRIGFMSAFDYDFSVFDNIKNHLINIKDSIVDIFSDEELQNAFFMMIRQWSATLGSFVGTAAKIAAEIAEGLVGGIDQYLEENKDYIKEKLTNIFNISGEISAKFREAFYGIADISEVFGSEEAQTLVANIIDCLNTASYEVTELVLKIGRDIVSGIAQTITENKDKIKEALTGVLSFGADITGTLKTSLEEAFGHLQEVYDDKIKPTIDELSSSISNILGKILDGWNQYVQPVLDGIAEKFEEIMNGNLGNFIEHIIDLVGNIIELVKTLWKEYLEPIVNFVVELLAPVFAMVLDVIVTTFLNAVDVISGFFDGVVQIFNGIIEFITGIFSGDLEKAVGGLGKIWEGIKTIFSSIWDSVWENSQEIWDKIKEHLGKIWEQIKQSAADYFKDMWEKVVERFNNIKDDASEIWEGIKKYLAGKWEEIKQSAIDYFKGIWEGIVGKFNDILDSAKSIWDDIKTAISDKLKEIYDGMPDWLKKIVDFISGKWGEAEEETEEGWEDIGDAAEGGASAIPPMLTAMNPCTDKVAEIWDNIKSGVSEKWSEIKTAVGDWATKTKDQVKSSLSGAKDKASEVWTNIKDGVGGAWNKVKTEVGDWATKTKDQVKSSLSGAKDKASEVWTSVKDGVGGAWNKVKDSVKTSATSVKDQVYTTLNGAKDKAKSAWDNVKNGVGGAWDSIKSSVSSSAGKVKDQVYTTLNGAKDKAKSAWDNVKNGVSGSWESIKSSVSSSASKVKDQVYTTLNGAKDKAKSAWTNVKNGVSGSWDSIKSSVSSSAGKVKDQVYTSLNGAKDKAKSAWTNVKNGVKSSWDGIRTEVSKAIDKVKGLFNFSWKLPKPKIPKFIPKYKKIAGVNIPYDFDIVWHAKGGIFTRPTVLGNHGFGEAGPEAILPLETLFDKMNDMFDNQNRTLASTMANNNSGPVTLVLEMNGEKVAKGTVKGMKDLARIGALDMTWI